MISTIKIKIKFNIEKCILYCLWHQKLGQCNLYTYNVYDYQIKVYNLWLEKAKKHVLWEMKVKKKSNGILYIQLTIEMLNWRFTEYPS